MDLDELIRLSGLRPGAVRAILAELNVDDQIDVLDDGFVLGSGP